MKRGAGKTKGNAFERSVAKELSRWLTGGTDSTQLIRSVSSGGWRTGRAAVQGWRQVGDLSPNGIAGERFSRTFAVECKARRTFNLWDGCGVGGKSGPACFLTWWVKITEESRPARTLPLLIVRALRKPILIGYPLGLFPPVSARGERIGTRIAFPFAFLGFMPFVDWLRLDARLLIERADLDRDDLLQELVETLDL